jgi:hypothetical protein
VAVKEEKDANGEKELRVLIDRKFKEAANFPFVVIAVEHDRATDVPFAKQKRRA